MSLKKSVVLLCMVSVSCLFAQETVQADKESLSSIRLGSGLVEVSYASNEEGFYSPEGPMVDREGRLLFYPTTKRDHLIVFYKGQWEAKPLYGFLEKTTGHQIQFISQQGYIGVGKKLVVSNPGNGSFYISPDKEKRIEISKEYKSYPMPFGGIMESIRPKFTYSTENINNKSQEVRNSDETRAWLPTQPGGFSIGDDGLLYRNGMLWSARVPSGGIHAEKYIGRLMSGHQVWVGGGIAEFIRYLTISNSQGQIEMVVVIPWGPQLEPRKYGFNPFNYGLGPWGEVYALIAPYSDEKSPWPPKEGGTSELVVIRNHLKYFGRLSADRVRLRKEPNTTSDIVGTYPVKTGFRIVETGTKKETIGDKTDVWYKVRLLDGKEGWFFGAFVANLYDGPGTPPPWPNVADW